MANLAAGVPDKLDPVWKALSDPTRRAILDFLRDRPRTTTEIVEEFPHLTRFGVMKHLDVLREAGLVQTHESGRRRMNSLNAVPIRQIYERWVSRFQELWSSQLLRIKETAEKGSAPTKPKSPRKPSTDQATPGDANVTRSKGPRKRQRLRNRTESGINIKDKEK